MSSIKNAYILLATILIIILTLDKCTSGPISVIKGSPEVIARDSVGVNFHTETIDTVIDTFLLVSEPVNIPVYVWMHDTMYLDVPNVIYSDLDTFYAPIRDSLLEANITVLAKERPIIMFDYKLKSFNTTITNSIKDSTFSEITEKVRVNQLYYGVEAIVYPGFKGIFGGIDFISKKGWQGEVSVGVAQFSGESDPMIKLGLKKLLTFRKRIK